MLHIASRVHAVRGDSAGESQVLAAAEVERETAEGRRDELHDGVAGEFRFDDARAAACAGAAQLKLGNGGEAVRYTRRTLQLYERDPEMASVGILNGARIDTAAALLLQGNLDEAREYVAAALALDRDADNVSLGGRLANVRRILAMERWTDDSAALQLCRQIDGWLQSSRVSGSL